MDRDEFLGVEKAVDHYLHDLLDEELPRNKFIYHCNLAFTDLLIDSKLLFTMMEKHYLFSLNYSTYIAHKKLKEEDTFDFVFDLRMYRIATQTILRGVQYSLLCDNFPLVHSGKSKLIKQDDILKFEATNVPRRNYKFISDYTIRKALSYTL